MYFTQYYYMTFPPHDTTSITLHVALPITDPVDHHLAVLGGPAAGGERRHPPGQFRARLDRRRLRPLARELRGGRRDRGGPVADAVGPGRIRLRHHALPRLHGPVLPVPAGTDDPGRGHRDPPVL